MIWRAGLCLAGLAALLSFTDAVSVMSVDLGSEWMKVAIVSPGVPMEIALNKESKRKTPVNVALRDGERTFGEDAASVGVRFPKNSYIYLLELLGKKVDNPIVQLFKKRFPYYDIVPDPERGTVLFKHDSETLLSVEELVAMALRQAREFAVSSAHGQPINEAVLTVPGFFNQAERNAMLQAAQLAGINVLQLINDYTAVALNYGIFRRSDFNETIARHVMFYDMGAASTTATVVAYQLVKSRERGFVETNPQLSVLGVGYDRTLGGFEMQLRLRDHLATAFNAAGKAKTNVFDNPRAMAKLFKEAGRVKNVLSANADHYAQVEGLLEDQDFKLQVTREQLEEMCADLFDRVRAPVDQALASAGLTIDTIDQVILVGAGTRVPKVQERLAAAVGTELGKNINTDEAAAMGAAYKAADLSAGFKVNKFLTKDTVIFPVQVVFEREVESTGATKQVKRTLFGSSNPFPQKKILTFNKHVDDFSFSVNYAELDHLPAREIEALGPLTLSRVDVTGVAAALAKHVPAPGVESKGIKAHFALDDSGILSLNAVELLLEKTLTDDEVAAAAAAEQSPLSQLGSKISKYFTGEGDKKEPEPEKPTEEGTEGKPAEEGKPVEEGDAEKPAPAVVNATKPGKPRVVVLKEPIETVQVKQDVPALAGERLALAVAALAALEEQDQARARRESALNALESFVFDTQTKLDTKEFKEAAAPGEADTIREACIKAAEWLDEEGMTEGDAAAYESRLKELRDLARPLAKRVSEHAERPEAIAALNAMLNGSATFLTNARNLTKDEPSPLFTAVELETLSKAIDSAKEWRDTMVAAQAALKAWQPPALTIKALTERMATLDREVKYLVNKAKIWKPKKPAVTEPEKNATTTTEGAEEKEGAEGEGAEGEGAEGEEVVVETPTEDDVKPTATPTQEKEEEQHTEL